MRRFQFALLSLALSAFLPGCGEEAPNTAATPEQVKNDPDFAKKTADMMRAANTGMDPKGKGAPPKAAPAPAEPAK